MTKKQKKVLYRIIISLVLLIAVSIFDRAGNPVSDSLFYHWI